jgi:hypothetical protein
MRRFILLLAAFLVIAAPLYSQKHGKYVFDAKSLVLPVTLIGAGAIGGQIDAVKNWILACVEAGSIFIMVL